MKKFKMSVSQEDTSVSIEFSLSEEKAVDLRVIAGTAINAVNEKLALARTLGAKLLKLNKPCEWAITAENFSLDSRLLDAGIIGAKKEFKATFKASASEKGQSRFAEKVWAATVMLMGDVKIRTIQDLTGKYVDPILLPGSANTEIKEETGIITAMPIMQPKVEPAKPARKTRKEKQEQKHEQAQVPAAENAGEQA